MKNDETGKANPIDLLFGDMDKLGPGSDVDTLKVLDMLPEAAPGTIVDAGCGTGRQTLALAQRLETLIHAVDTYEPFLSGLRRRAEAAGVGHLVQTHCMDMVDIPDTFHDIDLLWSEGAAYNIGFSNALNTWHAAVKPGGFAAVSELTWLRDDAPAGAREFFKTGYPAMQGLDENLAAARDAGYEILATHMLPAETWVEGYYEILGPTANALLDHADKAVRDFAAETVEEIRVFDSFKECYGYVFYVMRKAGERGVGTRLPL